MMDKLRPCLGGVKCGVLVALVGCVPTIGNHNPCAILEGAFKLVSVKTATQPETDR
jgi:hypothetical protein